MSELEVLIADVSEESALVAIITAAFITDPMARWSFPDAPTYLAVMPDVVRAFGGAAFTAGSAFHVTGRAAALWLPPGVEPDAERLAALVAAHAPPHVVADSTGLFEQMAQFHPTEPHWYLPLIGVDPMAQNQGHGSKLLRALLSRADRDGVSAYLESSNPRNIPLYERHGFEALGTIQVGSSPPLVPMLRRSR
jgi:ribosomal protein S18 acetylase RimI-like enzyme